MTLYDVNWDYFDDKGQHTYLRTVSGAGVRFVGTKKDAAGRLRFILKVRGSSWDYFANGLWVRPIQDTILRRFRVSHGSELSPVQISQLSDSRHVYDIILEEDFY